MDIDLLSKMVSELILDSDEVALPGVGTFVAEMVPASFSDKGYTINPPYRRLSFRQKQGSDNRLIEFYAAANSLEYEDAARILTRFLQEMKDVLKTRKTIILPGLGRLRATKENNFFFVPDPDMNIYPEGFGLESISLKTHVEDRAEVAAAVASLEPLLQTPVANVPEPAPAAPVKEEPSGSVTEHPCVSENEEPSDTVVEHSAVQEESAAAKIPAGESTAAGVPASEVPDEEPAEAIEPAPDVAEPAAIELVASPETVATPAPAEPAASPGTVAEPAVTGSVPPLDTPSGSAPGSESVVAPDTASASIPGPEHVASAGTTSPGSRIPKWVWIIPCVIVCIALLLGVYLLLARVAPDFIDRILYSPEELQILNYPLE